MLDLFYGAYWGLFAITGAVTHVLVQRVGQVRAGLSILGLVVVASLVMAYAGAAHRTHSSAVAVGDLVAAVLPILVLTVLLLPGLAVYEGIRRGEPTSRLQYLIPLAVHGIVAWIASVIFGLYVGCALTGECL